jgi:purine-nucleoside/S-methyl-5'-thioadenosine phosphorylase / adenosine deaminase
MPNPVLAAALSDAVGIAHGFFTRHGGVSQGIYASLNCGAGSKDDPAAVRENRMRVVSHLGAREIVSAHQVHGTTAVVVREPWPAGQRPRADALVTDRPGMALGVLTADCAPVLFADARAGVVAAAHAGWRGAIAGICEAAIAAMETLGAARSHIHAAVGPCIGQAAYQVGADFQAQFLAHDPANAAFFTPSDAEGRPHFDLPAYLASRLARSGVAIVNVPEACTFEGGSQFFSYRRSRLRNEADYGRQISAIVLT